MIPLIVDASVGLKWFIDEDLKDEAFSLLDCFHQEKIMFFVPDLFYLEMVSAFRKKIRRGLLLEPKASVALEQLHKFKFESCPVPETESIFKNALQLGISVYDTVYVTIAEFEGLPFITADESLVKICRHHGLKQTYSLKEFEP